MMYEVGYLIVPWTLFGIALIAVAKLWHMCRVLNKSNSTAQTELKKYVGVEGQVSRDFLEGMLKNAVEKREKAEANALESAAAHREAVRLLQVAEAELAKYRPNRDKKGHFIPKSKKPKVSKKL